MQLRDWIATGVVLCIWQALAMRLMGAAFSWRMAGLLAIATALGLLLCALFRRVLIGENR